MSSDHVDPPMSLRSARTPQACDRCRRQKLKCDESRPCVLCVRSGTKCQTFHRVQARSRKRHTKIAGNSYLHSSTRPRPIAPAASGRSNLPLNASKKDCLLSSASSSNDSRKQPGTGVNSSTIDFARHVFNEKEAGRAFTRASIVGDTGVPESEGGLWHLTELILPPEPVILELIDAYFNRMHWFILLFHEHSFREMAKRIISSTSWRNQDLGPAMAVLMVLAVGLQAALSDKEWPGHKVLHTHGIDEQSLLKSLIKEIMLHLIDLSANPQIETVQVCLLLSSYYVYHSAPNLAWMVSGMAVRCAYALDLHHKAHICDDVVLDEIRSRCWNHVIVADAFTSMIYGRPTAIDSEFAVVHPLRNLEDLLIDPLILGNPSFCGASDNFTRAAFHTVKYEIYNIVRRALVRIRRFQSQNEVTEGDIHAVAAVVRDAETLLAKLHRNIPQLFNVDHWINDGQRERLDYQLQMLPSPIRQQAETIFLQAATLQLTYDAATIQIHRPLLEMKHRDLYSQEVVDSIQRSLYVATTSAIRMSRIPVDHFRNHFAESFAVMHQFTAGVILCILPTSQPLTVSAIEAKNGVIRIIRLSSTLSGHNQIARQTNQLLTELLKVTSQREISSALNICQDPHDMKNHSESVLTINSQHPQSSEMVIDRREGTSIFHREPESEITALTPDEIHQDAVSYTLQENHHRFHVPSEPVALLPDNSLFPSGPIFQQLDDAFGAFGECKNTVIYLTFFHSLIIMLIVMFNLIPDDQSSAWGWGRPS
ncbi:hypothetical protein N7462_001975 [Penicillium macrosclerotiorum]|uniref:uncharacterized protein n=1 Tax=Penicillium macrosclerotiorum TaxID=303699 RepID=UPI002548A925|nr:uncharacterized protein N7462_001975 [Penicillium macrosclerotiorum]KAJ5692552.1 hypothetical protein N7462_001975 [Penicillium macrosclerotiorum]